MSAAQAFRWEKLGLVYTPPRDGGWRSIYGQAPAVVRLPKSLRVFIAVRPPRDADGLYKANTSWVDMSLDDPTKIIAEAAEPIIPFGRPGTFDEHGLMPSSMNWADGVLRMYYCGWMRLVGVPYAVSIGLAESRDGGATFQKCGEGPLFSRTLNEPFQENGPYVVEDNGVWHMWYGSGTGWIGDEAIYVIKYARSSDGIVWERDGKAIVSTVVENECQARPRLLKIGSRWHMWFSYRFGTSFRNAERGYRIGYAWSDDLRTWHRDDELSGIAPSPEGWDSQTVCYPCIFKAGEAVYMYYNGNDFGEGGFGCARETGTVSAYDYNVALRFTKFAAEGEQRVALRYGPGQTVSYGELNALANKMAAFLSAAGLRRYGVLGIVHAKSPHCYAAMVAALKLGAAYVNLDDQNPPARLAHILRTAQPTIVFGEAVPESFHETLAEANAICLELRDDAVRTAIESAPSNEPPDLALTTGADPAYIMYTSGSTGVPKGAIMTHANVLCFGEWIGSRFGVGSDDVMTNVNPMYFDNSVFDFYGAMLNGAALAPFTREIVADARALLEGVEVAGCTVWFSVPSLLIYLMSLKVLTRERLPKIRSFVFGGEGYPKPELRKLHAEYGSRSKLINVYGPTECTCMCSAWDVRTEDLEGDTGLVTLGPIAENFSMLVLDGDQPVDCGGVGELCLLGPQVGLGYANDPERTRASFTPNPLNRRWVERMYRTGDLVKLGSDGRMLDFVGRKDNQIKHMGYRIELEEIEAALNKIDGVVQCAVLLKAGRRSLKTLVAYVATSEALTEPQLRLALERLLPPYMIPQQFDVRNVLPKNANGKIDRVALAAE